MPDIIKQGASTPGFVELSLDRSVYTSIDISLYQNGDQVYQVPARDITFTGAGNAAFEIPGWATKTFSRGRVTVEVEAAKADGSGVQISDPSWAVVEGSEHI